MTDKLPHLIVVKLGTSTVTRNTDKLSRPFILTLIQQFAHLYQQGKKIVIVTSGAVAAGREVLGFPRLNRSMPVKQMLASVGQSTLMEMWRSLFSLFEIPVGQLLLTRSDFSNRQRYLNVRDTLTALLHHRVIPIINENDSVATLDTKVGDNDTLAALTANMLAAHLLVLLTDQAGLYDADPRVSPEARLIDKVDKIDAALMNLGKETKTVQGTGGMATKLHAAKLAVQSGIPTVIAASHEPGVLLRLASLEAVGTRFTVQLTARESRKRWLLSEKTQGVVVIDSGAACGISKKGASLLAIGVKGIQGHFERGSIVRVVEEGSEEPLAIGLCAYGREEIQAIAGLHSRLIAEKLGYTYGDAIIHRDNLALYG